MKPRVALLSILASVVLSAASPPASPWRRDEAFWSMLTPAAREILLQVQISVERECNHPRGQYVPTTNTIEICAAALLEEPERLRHEALHALDWAGGRRASDTNGFHGAVPAWLVARAAAVYGRSYRPAELWAMAPMVVGWDFHRLPAEVTAFYAPWFVEAER